MKKTGTLIVVLLALTMLVVAFAGCNDSKQQSSGSAAASASGPASASASASASAPEPVTVTDGGGRTVTVNQPVETILTVYGSKYMLALGLGEKMVNSSSGKFEQAVCPSLANGVKFGSDQMNAETILQIKPDVFIHSSRATELLDTTTKMGVPSIGLYMETPDEVVGTLEMLGKALGVEDKANEVIAYYKKLMDTATKLTSGVADADKPTAILMGNTIGKVAHGGMLQSIMIETAGGKNLAKDVQGEGTWPVVGVEQIFEWNPDFIFIMNSTSRDYDANSIMTDPAWANLKAVQAGHVYVVPSDIDSWEYPCVSSALGVLWMVNKMYPDKLSDADFEKYVNSFYKDLYNVTFTREQLNY